MGMVANSQDSVFNEIVDEHKTIQKPVWVKEMGNYNDMPIPFKKISLEEALHKIVGTNFVVEFRQIKEDFKRTGMKGLCSVKIFWFYDCGIVVRDHWQEKEFDAFRIGCEHKKIEETKLHHCYYRVKCIDCGFAYEYDCS